jgi:hypothetical protein
MGLTFLSTYYNYIMTNPQKGIWSFYNSRHDQFTMGIDPMNNISNNNKNTLCSYFISTVTLIQIFVTLIGPFKSFLRQLKLSLH